MLMMQKSNLIYDGHNHITKNLHVEIWYNNMITMGKILTKKNPQVV